MMVKIDDILSKQSLEELASFAERLNSEFPNNELELISEEDDVAHAVNVVASKNGFDMVALGTTGASGLKEVIMGSVAAKVVEHSKVPVLAIPASANFQGLNKVVVASDLRPVNAPDPARVLFPLLELHHPELTMVHVSKRETGFGPSQDGIDSLFSTYQPKFHKIEDSDIARGIMAFNRANGTDLTVMLQRRESAFIKWLMVSTSEEMAMHAKVPLLVLKD